MKTASAIIQKLGLIPHPEGGWYREVYRSATEVNTLAGSRSAVTTIYYLLEQGQVSRWHVVDADEIWHFYSGEALELLSYGPDRRQLEHLLLGEDVAEPRWLAVVTAGSWQAARPLGAYTLMGCTVAPGFEFSGFRFVSSLPDCSEHFGGPMARYSCLL